MKSKDWTAIAVIVVMAAIMSFVISHFLLSRFTASKLKVEVVQPISSDFALPDEKYFNRNSLNPTQLIQIGNDNNQLPFSGR